MPLAEPWRPWRAVAARVLWTYYRAVKGREGAPVVPTKIRSSRRGKEQWPLSSTVRGLRRAPAAAQQLVVFLHGYGADGNDLIDIGRAWQQYLPQAAFVSPHAPEPCGQAPVGRQWFPLTFRDPNERWIGVNKAAPVLERFLDAELGAPQAAALGAGAGRLQPGHHDGAACRACAAPRRRRRSSAIPASWSCRRTSMPKPLPPRSNRGRRCCWCMAIATTSSRRKRCSRRRRASPRSACRSNGTCPPGVGHGIDAEGLRHGGEFLARRLRR